MALKKMMGLLAPIGIVAALMVPGELGQGLFHIVSSRATMFFFSGDQETQVRICREMGGLAGAAADPSLMFVGAMGQHVISFFGFTEAAMSAMRTFPENKAVQEACANLISSTILFNRPLGLKAGANGALEMVLDSLTRWPDDPKMNGWGMAGCFFDAVPENRAKFMKLGGIEKLHAAFKRHYWNKEVIVQPSYAYSSVCYDKEVAVRCVEVGLIKDGVQAMRDHPDAFRVREELLQGFKALSVNYQEYTVLLVQEGLLEQLVKAINEQMTDPHLVSLCCENMAAIIGGAEIWSVQGKAVDWGFNATHRALATQVGAVEAVFKAVQNEGSMAYDRGIKDSGYNPAKDCTQALAVLAYNDAANQETLLQLGAAAETVKTMSNNKGDWSVQTMGCKLLRSLAAGGGKYRAAVEAASPPSTCQWNEPFRVA
mmetsp:Transcript_110423/g.235871  ORF Transcript_110423/g.235871 Transcript_110423/m.235871 type:complete len:428 (-) Transcript_110423:71-1354(-)